MKKKFNLKKKKKNFVKNKKKKKKNLLPLCDHSKLIFSILFKKDIE